MRALYRRLGGLPRALFINSTIALEGVVRFLKTIAARRARALRVRLLRLGPVRQHAELSAADGAAERRGAAAARRSAIIDAGTFAQASVIEIKPQLVFG